MDDAKYFAVVIFGTAVVGVTLIAWHAVRNRKNDVRAERSPLDEQRHVVTATQIHSKCVSSDDLTKMESKISVLEDELLKSLETNVVLFDRMTNYILLLEKNHKQLEEFQRMEIGSQPSRLLFSPPPPPSSPSSPSTLDRRSSAGLQWPTGDYNNRMKITVEDLLNVKLKPLRREE